MSQTGSLLVRGFCQTVDKIKRRCPCVCGECAEPDSNDRESGACDVCVDEEARDSRHEKRFSDGGDDFFAVDAGVD